MQYFPKEYVTLSLFIYGSLTKSNCSKSVQSLGLTAFVIQNKKQNKTTFGYVVKSSPPCPLENGRFYYSTICWKKISSKMLVLRLPYITALVYEKYLLFKQKSWAQDKGIKRSEKRIYNCKIQLTPDPGLLV